MIPPLLPRTVVCIVTVLLTLASGRPAHAASHIVAWGDNTIGQTTVPPDLTNGVAISAGGGHSAVLNADGTASAFGYGAFGQLVIPAGLANVVSVAAGYDHVLALRSDGSVVAWGRDDNGQIDLPAGLGSVTAVSANEYYSLALKSAGTVVAWGNNSSGQGNVPAGLNNVVAISAGGFHALALKNDGTIVGWGRDNWGQTDPPAGLTDVVAISAGGEHSLALKRDGTVVAWGSNNLGQTNVPPTLRRVVAIAAGDAHNLVIQDDGTVVAWGWNDNGQSVVPAGLANVRAISGGFAFSLALVRDDAGPPRNLTLICPPNRIFPCAQCETDPVVTGTPTVISDGPVVVSHSDAVSGSCPQVLTRTWTATDSTSGSSTSCVQTITCVPPTLVSLVTDSSGCTFDLDPSTPIQDFRLLFMVDPHSAPCFKLNASNPGQFFYNVFANGTPGDTLTFHITVPYPFITKGTVPFHAYDWVTVATGNARVTTDNAEDAEDEDDDDENAGQQNSTHQCLIPGNPIMAKATRIGLGTYGTDPSTTVTVTVKVPDSGFVYLAAQLDYGLKGRGGFTKDLGNDAVDCATGTRLLIPNHSIYSFSVSGAQNDTSQVGNINVFKRNPGVVGLVRTHAELDPVPGTLVTLINPRGIVVGSDLTDHDGFFLIVYKHIGKAATYRVSILTPNGYHSTKAVTLKANGSVQLDFQTP